MSRHVNQSIHNRQELELVSRDFNVVLNSGGPVMRAVTVEGLNVLCEWQAEDGTKQRHLFDYRTISRLIPFKLEGN